MCSDVESNVRTMNQKIADIERILAQNKIKIRKIFKLIDELKNEEEETIKIF